MTRPERFSKSILIYAVLGALAMSASFTVTGLAALRSHYKRYEEETLSLALKTKISAIEQYLDWAGDMGLQITSRTKIREYLEDYNRGIVSLDQLVAFSAPKLADAVHLSKEVAGISRFDVLGNPVVQVGLVIPGVSFSLHEKGNSRGNVFFGNPVFFDGEYYLPVFTQIINRNGDQVGTDQILCKTKTLQRIINDRAGIGKSEKTVLAVTVNGNAQPFFQKHLYEKPPSETQPEAERTALALPQAISATKGLLQPTATHRDFIIFSPLSVKGWGIAVMVDAADLQAPRKRAEWLLGCIATAITATGIVFMLLLLRPLTSSLQKEMAERRTREKELLLFRELLDQSSDGIFIVDPATGNFLDVNTRTCKVYGYSREELLQLKVADINPAFTDAAAWEALRRQMDSKKELMVIGEHRSKNGEAFPVEINIRHHTSPAGDYFIAAARDISDRLQAAERDAKNMAELAAINHLSGKVTASLSPEQVGKAIVQEMVRTTKADFAILYLLQGEDLVPFDTYSRSPFTGRDPGEPHRLGLCLCGLASQGTPVYSDNIHIDPRCTMRECKEAGLHSFAALPLTEGGQVIGVLGVATLSKRDFSEEADFLETLASQASMGIRNSLLYRQVQLYAENQEELVKERTKGLEKSQTALQSLLEDMNEAKKELETKVREIERMNRIFVNRELRMVELKKIIKALKQQVKNEEDSS